MNDLKLEYWMYLL